MPSSARIRGQKSSKLWEVYDRGNGATILLYNTKKKTVVLIRQFRVATWVNGNESGQLIESCAGLLDNDEPEVCITLCFPAAIASSSCPLVAENPFAIKSLPYC